VLHSYPAARVLSGLPAVYGIRRSVVPSVLRIVGRSI
jgi:hypothetical protein